MIRCNIEMVPGGTGEPRLVGLVEIANIGGSDLLGDYQVVLTKTPPFRGALRHAWRRGLLPGAADDAEILAGQVLGLHRERRGSYDLLYRALRSCGMDKRNR